MLFDSSGGNPPTFYSSPNTENTPSFNNNSDSFIVRQNAYNRFTNFSFNLYFHWAFIVFHSLLVVWSVAALAITWKQSFIVAPHLRFYIGLMSATSVARIFNTIYQRRYPFVVVLDDGTEIVRSVNTFWAKLAKAIHDNVDKVCVILFMCFFLFLDKNAKKDSEKKIPILFWTSMIWELIYFFYFVGPIFLILLVITCLPCLLLVAQRFLNINLLNQMENRRAAPATQEILAKVWKTPYNPDETFKYVNPDKLDQTIVIEKEDTKCSICLGWYEKGDDLRILPCSHHFHLGCADEWFKITATCPLCVRPIHTSTPASPNPAQPVAPDSNVKHTLYMYTLDLFTHSKMNPEWQFLLDTVVRWLPYIAVIIFIPVAVSLMRFVFKGSCRNGPIEKLGSQTDDEVFNWMESGKVSTSVLKTVKITQPQTHKSLPNLHETCNEDDSFGSVNLTRDQSGIATVNLDLKQSETSLESTSAICSICRSLFTKDNGAQTLPCSHHFHQKCADDWFGKRGYCPKCIQSTSLSYLSI